MPRDGAQYLTSMPVNVPGPAPTGPRTVVCFGLPRGGTSMAAGAILGLGVPMGDPLKNNIEDPEFDLNLQGGKSPAFLENVRKTIQHRNQAHEVWGWKCPFVAQYLPDIIGDIRNPLLVCVYRDPVPTALRAKVAPEKRIGFITGRMRAQVRNTTLIEDLGVPGLLVSYELATSHPDAFLEELAAYLGLDVPEHRDEILQFLAPGTYKDPSSLMARLKLPGGAAG